MKYVFLYEGKEARGSLRFPFRIQINYLLNHTFTDINLSNQQRYTSVE